MNQPYNATFTASGGTAPFSWNVIAGSLPGGLTLNASTGQISDTPTTAGTFTGSIQVQDSSIIPQAAQQTFSMAISGPSIVDISGLWFAEETVKAVCSLEGEGQESFEESGSGTINITQNGQQVSYLPPGLPPDGIRTGTVMGNMVVFTGKFIIALPGLKINFTENLATGQGTIGQNRIDLTGTGIARGTVVGFGQGECTGTSTAVLTR